MNIEDNVARIRERMDRAAGGRPVTLVAATKMNDAQAVRRAIAAGVDACGENRVQEMMEKLGQDAYAGAPLHFIGSLQKNKVKFVVGNCDLIHSVNSVELLEAIARKAAALDIVQDVLLEVNIAAEASKTGFLPEYLPQLLESAGNFSSVRVRGLMAIPPIAEKPGENRRYFAQMRELFIDIGAKKYDNVTMDFLSMGMSEDFEDAIAEGSNMIRVGSAIFGPRNYGTAPGTPGI
ncbi:MAG: YggS family pyridoxal phosphate-dependent enzyme [Oscillospiraceae bacterium]|nr:YggS family pyridoxal phosphate-dependent enzyme [Oscillospiraceae bacterium]MDD6502834.1 YggS family pyridoxal phosphate-dependent enzyme [Oscillospiraceae bacterium]